MDLPVSLDRRRLFREPLFQARRRYPRLSVVVDAFYESDDVALTCGRLDLSMRGAFLSCHAGDDEGAEGILRVAISGGPMLRARVHVVRRSGGTEPGMALRFLDLSDGDRLRLAAFLVRSGGLSVIPALEQRFGGWARMPHAGLRRELRHRRRAA